MSFNCQAAPPPLLLPEDLKYSLHLKHICKLIEELTSSMSLVKVLEIGCGGGVNLYPIKKRYGDKVAVYGLDISPVAIDYAKKLSIGEFRQGSADQRCFSEKFDVIIISDVLEHLPGVEQVAKTLEVVQSSLTDHGLFYLLCPIEANPFSLYWWFYKTGVFSDHSRKFNGHNIQFRPEQLIEILERYFSVKELEYSCHFFGQLSVFLFFVLKREILTLFGSEIENKFRDSNMVLEGNKFLLFLRKLYSTLTRPLQFVAYYESQFRRYSKFAAHVLHAVMTKTK